MEKLLNLFRSAPTDANRVKLNNYIRKHSMAVCMLMPEEVAYLRSNGFTV